LQEAPDHKVADSTSSPAAEAAVEKPARRDEVKVRSGGVDAVRVLAVVAVVLGHVWTNDFVYRLVYPWHVAVFFFLSGYLWSPGRTLRTEVARRWHSLAIPYLVWLAVLLLGVLATHAVHGNLRPRDVVDPLYGGALATRPFSAYWFLTVLFFVAVLARLLERLPIGVRASIVVLGLAAGYAAGPLLAKTPLAIGSALPCLSILVLGRLFALVRQRIPLGLPLGLAAGVLGSVLVWTGVAQPLNIKLGDYGTPIISILVAGLYCIALVLVFEALFRSLPSVWSFVATLLASAGLTVVLTHAVVLDVLDVGPAGSLFAFAAAVVLPWAVGVLLYLTPASAVVNGVPGHRRRALARDVPAVGPASARSNR
jgi:acyltransferase